MVKNRITYPWGQQGPRTRLKQACGRLRQALAAASEPGYADIGRRLESVVQAAQPLAVAVRYVADNGLFPKSGAGAAQRMPAADLRQALQAIDAAVLQLAQASVGSVSEDYRTFAEAADGLIAAAGQAIEAGVRKQPRDDTDAAWARFGA